jgi:LPXTG-site transpeptidase (sortase) family protein
MFYTDNMPHSERKTSIILILTGMIILYIGIIGVLSLNNSQKWIEQKGNYRFFEKSSIDQSEFATLVAQDPTAELSLVINTPIPRESEINYQEIRPFLNFIHTNNNKLESPAIPDRIEIPSIKLVAPVVVSDFNITKVEGETFGQWIAPSKFAAGWHPDSALLGEIGNTVINGHHNEFGEVFGSLVDVKIGDLIIVSSGGFKMEFVVSNRMILAERFQSTEVRLDNARWLAKTDDIRLTLVTCYPKESNTHRLIIVARPLSN